METPYVSVMEISTSPELRTLLHYLVKFDKKFCRYRVTARRAANTKKSHLKRLALGTFKVITISAVR